MIFAKDIFQDVFFFLQQDGDTGEEGEEGKPSEHGEGGIDLG